MKAQLGRYSDTLYAILRIVAGFLFACHGAQKMYGLLTGSEPPMPMPLFLTAGTIELVGGIMIAIGFLTSWAAFVSSGLMACGYFMAHQPQGVLPIQNNGELAALYAFLFLYMASRGSGPLSVDGR